MKIELPIHELSELYFNKNMSQKQIAKHFNCSVDTVQRNMNEYNIHKTHSQATSSTIDIPINGEFLEVLNGTMLGDGSLIIHRNGLNAYFSYTSKSYQHVEYISKYFGNYITKSGIAYCSYYDKRTDKEYSRYTIKTVTSPSFTQFMKDWYDTSGKHLIPYNLTLSPTSCLIWYIGDGGICNCKNSYEIKLSTHRFYKDEITNILLPQLKQFDPILRNVGISKTGNEQYCIYIPRRHVDDFLCYIGECPFEDYKYKWTTRPYKHNDYSKYYDEWVHSYINGETYSSIARRYNADPTTVLWHLKTVGVHMPIKRNYSEYHKQWIQEYIQGHTVSEIANKYGCCNVTVLNFLKKENIIDAQR